MKKKKGSFPAGEKNIFGKSFIGQSYYKALVADPKVSVGVGNATFEPNAETTGILIVVAFCGNCDPQQNLSFFPLCHPYDNG